ncbi:MAG: hypothetical protein M0004_09725 [Actinomycetota bacterium]|nr:hypothetical protein [Actinomycetota bacterium]
MNELRAPAAPLFLAPLRTEALAVRRGARGGEVVRIGMGPVRATAARTRLERSSSELPIVLLGFGGALSASLRAGDLVVASSCLSSDEDDAVLLPDAPSVARLLGSAALPGAVHLGPVLSTPRVLRGTRARADAAARGAIAVDMESRWCAPLSRTHPFVVVRAVVDVPGHDVVSVATPAATWKAVRSLAAATSVLRNWSPLTLNEDCKVGDH